MTREELWKRLKKIQATPKYIDAEKDRAEKREKKINAIKEKKAADFEEFKKCLWKQ